MRMRAAGSVTGASSPVTAVPGGRMVFDEPWMCLWSHQHLDSPLPQGRLLLCELELRACDVGAGPRAQGSRKRDPKVHASSPASPMVVQA